MTYVPDVTTATAGQEEFLFNVKENDVFWIITKADEDDCLGTYSGQLESEPDRPDKFRLLDDDGEVYYEGLIYDKVTGFEPLEEFGTPNAGCTEIQYLNASGEWESL